jgi:proteasome accessory factor B
MHPLERLVNLVALLLESPRPLTFDEIRDAMPEGYAQDDASTAKRMFERDKDILRDVGVPIRVQATDVWDVEQGYVIDKAEYYLPEVELTPEEVSALFVAARASGTDETAEQAALKLLYGAEGGLLSGAAAAPLAADGGAADPKLGVAADAVTEHRSLRFAYRTSRGTESERHVDPYGLVFRGGHWYVVGLDRERGEIRSFRLSRIRGDVRPDDAAATPPEGFRAADHVQASPWGPGEAHDRARIAFSPDVAWYATRSLRDARVERTRDDAWVEVTVPAPPGDAIVSWVLSFGPDAVLLEPEALRQQIVRRLEAVIA